MNTVLGRSASGLGPRSGSGSGTEGEWQEGFPLPMRGVDRDVVATAETEADAEADAESRTEADIEIRTMPKVEPDVGCLTLELEGAC